MIGLRRCCVRVRVLLPPPSRIDHPVHPPLLLLRCWDGASPHGGVGRRAEAPTRSYVSSPPSARSRAAAAAKAKPGRRGGVLGARKKKEKKNHRQRKPRGKRGGGGGALPAPGAPSLLGVPPGDDYDLWGGTDGPREYDDDDDIRGPPRLFYYRERDGADVDVPPEVRARMAADPTYFHGRDSLARVWTAPAGPVSRHPAVLQALGDIAARRYGPNAAVGSIAAVDDADESHCYGQDADGVDDSSQGLFSVGDDAYDDTFK